MGKVCVVCGYPFSKRDNKSGDHHFGDFVKLGDVGQDDASSPSQPRPTRSRSLSIRRHKEVKQPPIRTQHCVHTLCLALLETVVFQWSSSSLTTTFLVSLSELEAYSDGRLRGIEYKRSSDLLPSPPSPTPPRIRSTSIESGSSSSSSSSASSSTSSVPSSLFSNSVWSSRSKPTFGHARTFSGTSVVESEVPSELFSIDTALVELGGSTGTVQKKITLPVAIPPTPTLSSFKYHLEYGASLDFDYSTSGSEVDADDESLADILDYELVDFEGEPNVVGETKPVDGSKLRVKKEKDSWIRSAPDLWPTFYSSVAPFRHLSPSTTFSRLKASLPGLPLSILLRISSFLSPTPDLVRLGMVCKRLRSFALTSLQPRFKKVVQNLGWGLVPKLRREDFEDVDSAPHGGVRKEVALMDSNDHGDWLLYLYHLHRLPTDPELSNIEKDVAKSIVARQRIVAICRQIGTLLPSVILSSSPYSTSISTEGNKTPVLRDQNKPGHLEEERTTLRSMSVTSVESWAPLSPPSFSSTLSSASIGSLPLSVESRASSTAATSVSQLDLSCLPSPTLSLSESEFVALTPRNITPPLPLPNLTFDTSSTESEAKSTALRRFPPRKSTERPIAIYVTDESDDDLKLDRILPPLPPPSPHTRLPTSSVYGPTSPFCPSIPLPLSPVDSISGLASAYSEVGTSFSLYSTTAPKRLRNRLFRSVQ